MADGSTQYRWHIIAIGTAVGIFFIGLGVVAAAMVVRGVDGKVLPNVTVAGLPVGGLIKEDVADRLVALDATLANAGIAVSYAQGNEKKELVLFPATVGSESAEPMIRIDVEKESDAIIQYGKSGSPVTTFFHVLNARFRPTSLSLRHIEIRKNELQELLKNRLATYEKPVVPAELVVRDVRPLAYEITPENTGIIFNYDEALIAIEDNWRQGKAPKVHITEQIVQPSVTKAQLEQVTPQLPRLVESGDLVLSASTTPDARAWTVAPENWIKWLTSEKPESGAVELTFSLPKVESYIDTYIRPHVTVAPVNARFSVTTDGKVEEFQPSSPGIALNVTTTLQLLDAELAGRQQGNEKHTVVLALEPVEPLIKTSDVNALGITEVLGVGISNFSGSPTNRRKNIANAVKKLNGVIVPADAEFSAIKYTQPYTIDGGYLPELVIKGDALKPEIGGGLCQIGTTLFRMAMNGGLPIVERRNHSLVVQYYGDVRNGLPGTDATIYEPSPDFRFKNDTGHAILIETDMDTNTGELRFTLWGTSDGRKGSYSEPVVKRWIPHGPTKLVETEKLAPGVKECQHAFRGAEASFTYTRELSDGTKQEEVFTSYYRPLPEICLVGIDPNAVPTPSPDEDGANPEATPDGEPADDIPVLL